MPLAETRLAAMVPAELSLAEKCLAAMVPAETTST